MEPEFRPIVSADFAAIVPFTASMLSQAEFECTIFSCQGYTEFLQRSLKLDPHTATRLIGIYLAEKLIGFAEWRRMEPTFILNNLFICEGYRGLGIGSKMMRYGYGLAKEQGLSSITLDVFAWNEPALKWYRSHGFVEASRSYWYKGANPLLNRMSDKLPEPWYIVEDHPQAEVLQAVFGFSQLRIRLKQKEIHVGRLGPQYFRFQAPNGELDAELLGVLAHMEPERALFVMSPYPSLVNNAASLERFSESIRMQKILQD